MSRYQTSREGQTIAYGFDHMCGYFYQLFDAEDELIEESDSLFDNLTGLAWPKPSVVERTRSSPSSATRPTHPPALTDNTSTP